MPAYVPPAALTAAAINAALGYTAANQAAVVTSFNGAIGAVTGVPTDVGYNAVGSIAVCTNNSGGAIASGASVSGASIRISTWDQGTTTWQASAVGTGTWRCIGVGPAASGASVFQRIA